MNAIALLVRVHVYVLKAWSFLLRMRMTKLANAAQKTVGQV